VEAASENGKSVDPGEEQSHGPRECMPCRGTGRVISNLGGSAKEVQCPWCEGGGTRREGIDAQARWPPNEPAGEQAPQAEASQPADGS